MKLFLAQFTLEHTRYMGKTTKEAMMRLVWATTEEEAQAKIEAKFNSCAAGDDSYWTGDFDINEAIE